MKRLSLVAVLFAAGCADQPPDVLPPGSRATYYSRSEPARRLVPPIDPDNEAISGMVNNGDMVDVIADPIDQSDAANPDRQVAVRIEREGGKIAYGTAPRSALTPAAAHSRTATASR